MALLVEEEIKTICSSLKEYKIPAEYICIDKMPMTQNLKVDFKALERKALLEKEKVFVKKLNKAYK
jgi:acyl-CoA synthetase (AMP-forming)/AMP-acid ligase II